jgi:4-hydroxybenzoate polyprenyltransferase
MKQLNLFIELIRLKKPIGFMLLFWPCAWGLTLAYDFSNSFNDYLFYLSLFFLGSVLMRSAGCIMNDISDKEFDKDVQRTKDRPIASNKISVKLATFYVIILCSLAFLVLIRFNTLTIILALCSMPLAFTYPLMKRLTYWPQLFLGITFNYGLILGWVSIKNQIDIIPIIFYFGAIFWTLAYDTIYGFQDIKDDEIIGVKSTSIKFKDKPKKLIFVCFTLLTLSILISGYLMHFNLFFYLGTIFLIYHLFFYQLRKFNFKDTENCLKIFKSNNIVGLLVLFNIFLGKF